MELITPRLRLRPTQEKDIPIIQAAFERWEVVQFLSAAVPWPYPENGATQFFQNVVVPGMRDGTSWHWALTLAGGPDDIIGSVGLFLSQSDEAPCCDSPPPEFAVKKGGKRGFWLLPEYWRQGLMQEASDVVTRYAFEQLQWDYLSVCNADDNSGSSAIKLHQGFVPVRQSLQAYVSGTLPSTLWILTRDKFQTLSG